MNENIDLTKILKDCPKGTKFYTPIWGEVSFEKILDITVYTIEIDTIDLCDISIENHKIITDMLFKLLANIFAVNFIFSLILFLGVKPVLMCAQTPCSFLLFYF